MDGLEIRAARSDERARLEDLQRRASLIWEDYREQLLARPDAIHLPQEHVEMAFVAEREGKLLGFGLVLPLDDGDAELDGLFVDPDAWGQAIGRALVEAAAERAREQGATTLRVIANPRAVDFYTACGFQEQGSASTEFGPAPLMRRSLEQSRSI